MNEDTNSNIIPTALDAYGPATRDAPIITKDMQDQLINQLKIQSPLTNIAAQNPAWNRTSPPDEWLDSDDVFNEFGRTPTKPNFAGILKHLEEDIDLGRAIAVDREIGEIIAMPRVVALSLQRWLQWEVRAGGKATHSLTGRNLGQFIAMFAKKMTRRKESSGHNRRSLYEDVRDHCRAECDRLGLSKELWPIVALHEDLEQRGAFK